MAGMRNILVHAYATVNRDIVIDSASKLKEDVPRIVKAIKEGLEGKTVDPPSMDALHETLHRLLRGRVKAALLFGGRAKGYSLKGDYDIAVFFGRPHNLYDLGELAADITRTLKISEDKLNLIDLDSAPPEIVLEALNGKPIFVEDEYILFELKLKAIFELLDIQSGVQACLKSS
jgi:predicted nucleotidyltransferase